MYVASFFCNMGNYKSFGDTKFIPALPKVLHAETTKFITFVYFNLMLNLFKKLLTQFGHVCTHSVPISMKYTARGTIFNYRVAHLDF